MSVTSDKDGELVNNLSHLLWGNTVAPDLFSRWNQGLQFSDTERTILVQQEGGPCAVLAPLQAFLVKNLLFSDTQLDCWKTVDDDGRGAALCIALYDILKQAKSLEYYTFVEYFPSEIENQANEASSSNTPSAKQEGTNDGQSSPKKGRFGPEEFHANLRFKQCREDEVKEVLKSQYTRWRQQNGVLLFMYSVVLTKGLEQIKNEVEDASEPMIDSQFGHGSQSLINLFITGQATSHVFDNETDVSGLTLRGISSKPTVGFLTQMEHLRYCEVGTFLKNPVLPIWVLASETHLTVLFSQDKSLVTHESVDAAARRAFSTIDRDDNGFISVDNLADLMSALDLVSEPEYVKIMADKMDPEQLGIITLSAFLDEFFPPQPDSTARAFTLFHCNGLARNGRSSGSRYAQAQAYIMDLPELQIITDVSQIKSCLMTKWPTIELRWENDVIPSLN